jgi:Animal haem peroxidase
MIAAFDSGIPVALRAVTMLGVEQSRSWNTASLNEFRHFFGLVEHNTFEHVNSDPEMQKLLRQLYEHPDNIELYPGILIENTKKKIVPGSGLCPNQTIGKAILSDAIALVRGDRFFTVVHLSLFGISDSGLLPPNSDAVWIQRGCQRYECVGRWRPVSSIHARLPRMVRLQLDLRLVSSHNSIGEQKGPHWAWIGVILFVRAPLCTEAPLYLDDSAIRSGHSHKFLRVQGRVG